MCVLHWLRAKNLSEWLTRALRGMWDGTVAGDDRTGVPVPGCGVSLRGSTGPAGGARQGDDSYVFIVLVLVFLFERASNRSSGDTGRLAPEPPIDPIYAIVYIVLRIYDSSIK